MTLEVPSLQGVEHRYLDIGGVRIHVAEAGQGEPVLMLHGWPQNWYCWRHVIPRLADSYRVICPDMRGFGSSQAPSSGYEKEQLVDDALGLLDALDIEQVRLVGHDWGGWIGFLLCLRAPERISQYLALNVVHPWQSVGKFLPHAWRFWYQAVIDTPLLGSWILRNRPSFVRSLLQAGVVDRSVWTDTELDLFSNSLREPARANATVQLYRTFALRELLPILRGRYKNSQLKVPTKLVFGERDMALSPKLLTGYEQHAQKMSVELVPDCGHFIADERPDIVADRALQLFKQKDG